MGRHTWLCHIEGDEQYVDVATGELLDERVEHTV